MEYSQYVEQNTDWKITKEVLNRLLRVIMQDLKRDLKTSEVNIAKRNLGATSPKGFKSMNQYVQHVAGASVREISKMHLGIGRNLDIHEMQKTIINEDSEADKPNPINQALSSFNPKIDISEFLGTSTMRDLVSIVAPSNAAKRAYIVLDTRYRSIDTDGITSFRWNLSSSIQTTPGSVNNIHPIRNVTSIRTYPLRIPYAASADSYYSRISMSIVEFNSQAAIMNENAYSHFMFRPVRNGQFIELETTNFNDGIMEFASPINNVSTLTIKFFNPIQPVSFSNDRLNVMVLQYGTNTIMRTLAPHGLQTGDLVILSDYTTLNPTSDYVTINQINLNDGLNIDTSQLPNSSTDFNLQIDTSTLIGAGAGTVAVTINSASVTGTGTVFYSFFRVGDVIVLAGNIYFIGSISSDTSLLLKTPYGGTTASGLSYSKNNTIPNMQFLCYFASQRIFIPMMISYIDANLS